MKEMESGRKTKREKEDVQLEVSVLSQGELACDSRGFIATLLFDLPTLARARKNTYISIYCLSV